MLSETRQTQTKTACSPLDVQPRKVDSIEVKVTIVATRGRKEWRGWDRGMPESRCQIKVGRRNFGICNSM